MEKPFLCTVNENLAKKLAIKHIIPFSSMLSSQILLCPSLHSAWLYGSKHMVYQSSRSPNHHSFSHSTSATGSTVYEWVEYSLRIPLSLRQWTSILNDLHLTIPFTTVALQTHQSVAATYTHSFPPYEKSIQRLNPQINHSQLCSRLSSRRLSYEPQFYMQVQALHHLQTPHVSVIRVYLPETTT